MIWFIVICFLLEVISIMSYVSERIKNKDLCEEHEREMCDLIMKHGKETEEIIMRNIKIMDSSLSENRSLRKRIKELEDELNKIKSDYVNVENESVENESCIYVTLLEMLNKYKFCKDHKEITDLIGETASKILIFGKDEGKNI
jgi:hypothetical protein